ncbi:methyltransferase CmcJ [Bisporella sp. PMI_857]|nr:methyltransferase CmcJ [Bisporella sp. PMI_857]
MESQKLEISLKFLEWQTLYETEKPFQIFINIPEEAEDKRDTNLVFHDVRLQISDARDLDQNLSIDEKGFVYRRYPTSVMNFTDRKMVEDAYLPEIEAILRRELDGVDRVFFFDWRLRINSPELEGSTIDMNDLTTWLRPAMHVHIDQSPAATLKRVQLHLGDEAEFLLQGRVRVINVWRPLIDSVEDWPLAMCDGSVVNRSDLVETDHIRRHYMGSTMYLMHNPQQRFYYMSNQSKDDVLIFKNFDSSPEVAAAYAPHASFLHPNCPKDATPRQSIEVRALVFTYSE